MLAERTKPCGVPRAACCDGVPIVAAAAAVSGDVALACRAIAGEARGDEPSRSWLARRMRGGDDRSLGVAEGMRRGGAEFAFGDVDPSVDVP